MTEHSVNTILKGLYRKPVSIDFLAQPFHEISYPGLLVD